MRSFVQLVKVDPGFRTEKVLALGVGLPRSRYAEPQRRADFFRQLEAGIRQLPGVVSVGAVSRLPLQNQDNNITSFLSIEGRPTRAGEAPEVDFRRASSGYFATLGIPLLKGRFLNDQDGLDNPPVTVINEAAARRFWPTEDPIGKRIQLGSNPSGSGTWLTIVGVVGSVRHVRLDAEPRPEVYRHYQTSPLFGPIVVVRASSDPMALVGALRNQVHLLDRDLPISDIRTMSQIVSRSVAQRRFTLTLLGVFSAIAMLLAAVGIYGVMSYLVTQRTREIGIRRALGAQASDVLRLVVGQGLLLTLSGVAAGLVVSVVLTRVLKTFLFGVSPTDPLTFLAVALLLTSVALLACYIPARRATRVDPMVALRYE
jgi:predicted permease